ncbi:MAG: hypothetical protein ACI8P7_000759 [Candidatus Azotimanducaceae bacterium]|jgi:hypothetical protein
MKTKLLSASVGLMSLALCTAPNLAAQIITAPDIGLIGAVVNNAVDLDPVESILPGADGLNAVWNFSDLEGTVDQVLTLVDPKLMAEGVDFPNANLAVEVNLGEGHLFMSLDPDKLQIIGQVGDVDQLGVLEGFGLLDLTNLNIEVPLLLPDPAVLMEFPLQFADVFQSHATTIFEMIDSLTMYVLTVKRRVDVNVTVDAEGALILPGPVIFEAIRLNKVVVTTDSLFIDILGIQVLLSVDVLPKYVYTYLTEAPELAGMPLVELVYDPFAEEVDRASYFKSSSVGIKEPLTAQLQVYPNPSSEIANVVFGEVVSGSLNVYDSKGSIVNTIMIEGNSAQVDVTNLPAGLYQVHFYGKDKMLTKNLNVIK